MNAIAHDPDLELSDLLTQIAGGDRRAFGRLYDLTSSRLFAVTRCMLRRPEMAEEALQETFVRIWQKAGAYDPGQAKPMGWLATIARNQAIDLRRRAAERETDSLEDDEGQAYGVMPEAHFSFEMKRLRDCLALLPDDRQDMVLLAYYQGWSRDELAARFSRPVTTIKTLLRRSLAILRECIDGKL